MRSCFGISRFCESHERIDLMPRVKRILNVKRSLGIAITILFLSFSSIFSPHAFADGAKGGGRYEAFMSAGYLGLSSSATEFDIAPGFQLIPFPTFSWLQAGGEITYQKIGYRGGSASNLMILAGVTGNLGPSINDAFFVSLGVAIRSGSADLPDDTTTDPNGFGFYFFAGKRFPIGGGFSMRPSMGVVSCGTTGMVFRPFAISYTF